ncbi:AI-2E family transporter [Bacillus kexueae]|uniref:AI-2E family transporter n=1 Tax=Aeribacillus kexueae TaxID=2078952 RepID=UPI00311AB192
MTDQQRKWLYWLFILLLSSLFLLVMYQLKTLWEPFYNMLKAIFIPFFISLFITYLLHPTVEKLHKKGVPRPFSIIIIYLLFFGGLIFALYKGTPVLIEQMKDLSNNIPNVTASYQQWMDNLHDQTSKLPLDVHERFEKMVQNVENQIGNTLERLVTSFRALFDYVLIFAVIPFLVFYLLKDYDLMKRVVWYLTPKRWRKDGKTLLHEIDASLGNYIRGQLLVCLTIAILATISFWLFDIKYALILGIIVGATNVIPYFGPVIGAIPAAILAAADSVDKVIVVVIIVFVLQFIEGNLLSPLIVGKSLHMHPVLIILALLAGGEIGGIIGLILAVPIVSILKVVAVHTVTHLRTD